MLWFDNDPKTELPEKISRAAEYYRKKYGRQPNLCVVNPRMLGAQRPKSGRMVVETSAVIQPNHLWIGVESRPS